MKFHPHEYQSFAIDFLLSHPVAALLLDMGLGKTVITLTAIESLLHDSFSVSRVLVVAPLRVAAMTWPEEIRRWDHLSDLTYAVAVGSAQERRAAVLSGAEITLINRENLHWLVSESGLPMNYDMLVIDELSSFKNIRSQRVKAFMKLRPQVEHVVGLTGTPAPNGLLDLFSEYRCLDMGKRLGRFIGQYRDAYFIPARRNGNVIYSYRLKPGADRVIYSRIRDITVSMKALDHLPMPALISNACTVKLSDSEMEQYDALCEDMVLSLDSLEEVTAANAAASSSQVPHPFASADKSSKAQSLHCSSSSRETRSAGLSRDWSIVAAANAAALANKLCQLANGCVYTDEGEAVRFHSRKLDALEDLIESATTPVLVAYWYRHDLQRITERLTAMGVSFAVLKTPEAIARWNAGELPVGLIHPASAGHGLNLQQGGHHIIWYSLTWSLELYEQVNARLWRQGQTARTVVVTHIIAEDTIDEAILKALSSKSRTQEALISAVRAALPGHRKSSSEGEAHVSS